MAKKSSPKIVAFSCNWSAHHIVDEAEATKIQLPPNVKYIKVMCGGMVTTAFILRAFELGADGVFLATCPVEDCHYITGAKRAVEVYENSSKLIEMLGIEPERLKLGWFSVYAPKKFEKEINDFVEKINKIGPTPIKSKQKKPVSRSS